MMKRKPSFGIPVIVGITVLAATILLFRTASTNAPEKGVATNRQENGGATLRSGGDAPTDAGPREFPAKVRDRRQAEAESEVRDLAIFDLSVEKREPLVSEITVAESAYEMRSESRVLPVAFSGIFEADPSSRPETLKFPLFGDDVVVLKFLRHQTMGARQGVVIAKAEGEPDGGHVVLSYVGDALAGMIHLPLRGEFYEIRNGPGERSHVLTQLDPNEMPKCGICAEH